MPKTDRDAKNSKVKIRYMEVEAEGSSETIQDAWRSLQSAFARPRPVPGRMIAAGSGPVVTAETGEASFSAEEHLDLDADASPADTEVAPKATRPKAPARKEPTWEILKIDGGTGPDSLEAFMHKAPDVLVRRFLMCIYWLKMFRNIDAVNPRHIVTCYRLLGWPAPSSILMPLADMKRKKSTRWIDKAQGEHEYTINQAGVSEVERMLKAP